MHNSTSFDEGKKSLNVCEINELTAAFLARLDFALLSSYSSFPKPLSSHPYPLILIIKAKIRRS
jgi:hypothetical protein